MINQFIRLAARPAASHAPAAQSGRRFAAPSPPPPPLERVEPVQRNSMLHKALSLSLLPSMPLPLASIARQLEAEIIQSDGGKSGATDYECPSAVHWPSAPSESRPSCCRRRRRRCSRSDLLLLAASRLSLTGASATGERVRPRTSRLVGGERRPRGCRPALVSCKLARNAPAAAEADADDEAEADANTNACARLP